MLSVSICGGSRYFPNTKTYNLAYKIAKELDNNNIRVICGAGRGIMSAIGQAYSTGNINLCTRVGIQQDFEENAEDCYRFDGNGILQMTGSLNEQSNYIINNGNVIIFFPGGSGTMNEFFNLIANKIYINKPIICIGKLYKDLVNIIVENDRNEGTDNFRFVNYINNKIFLIDSFDDNEIIYRVKEFLQL